MIDKSKRKILVRESEDGWLIRAENFVQRAEPGETVGVTLFAARYGQPLPNTTVQISIADPDNNPGMNPGKDDPKATSPYINIPLSAVSATEWDTSELGSRNLSEQAYH